MMPDSDTCGSDNSDIPSNGRSNADAVLSAYALRTVVTPSNVLVDAWSTKVGVFVSAILLKAPTHPCADQLI